MNIKTSGGIGIYSCGYDIDVDATPDLVIAPLTVTIAHNETFFT
jgi:hypothetical protein